MAFFLRWGGDQAERFEHGLSTLAPVMLPVAIHIVNKFVVVVGGGMLCGKKCRQFFFFFFAKKSLELF